MKLAISQLIGDPESGLIVVAIGSSAQFNPELAVKPIIDAVREMPTGAPVVAFPLPMARESITMLEAAHIPCFTSVESCTDSISLFLSGVTVDRDQTVCEYHNKTKVGKVLQNIISETQPSISSILNEVDSCSVFSAVGINGPHQIFIPNQDDLSEIAAQQTENSELKYPLVAKLVSSDLPHKTEHGAIILNISNGAELTLAVTKMLEEAKASVPNANIDGVLLQEMVSGLGEALIGLRRDNLVGPIVTIGSWRFSAEIYKDVSHRLAPVSLETARQMIAEITGFESMRGYRKSSNRGPRS